MNIKPRLLIKMFTSKDIYFRDTKEYLLESVEKGLTYKILKYMYKKLYNRKKYVFMKKFKIYVTIV